MAHARSLAIGALLTAFDDGAPPGSVAHVNKLLVNKRTYPVDAAAVAAGQAKQER